MNKHELSALSRRERQIMDILFRCQEATVAQVLEALPDPPSYSTVRALLRLLDQKGYAKFRQQGPRYIYSPAVSHQQAQTSALRRLLGTFFQGSTEKAVVALLDLEENELTEAELDGLSERIEAARKKGR
ncbi:MAG: BlaI/MecI/CopY family transcriptional regulator [Candidatus Latescibacteria bacterium]|nr:BlaI/MecI/CopY family transcriptional regulator [Candidatus Latescibacterota bacterium]